MLIARPAACAQGKEGFDKCHKAFVSVVCDQVQRDRDEKAARHKSVKNLFAGGGKSPSRSWQVARDNVKKIKQMNSAAS